MISVELLQSLALMLLLPCPRSRAAEHCDTVQRGLTVTSTAAVDQQLVSGMIYGLAIKIGSSCGHAQL